MTGRTKLSIVLGVAVVVGGCPAVGAAAPPKRLGQTLSPVVSDQRRYAISQPTATTLKIFDFKRGTGRGLALACDPVDMGRGTPALIKCLDENGGLQARLLNPATGETSLIPGAGATQFDTIGRYWLHGYQTCPDAVSQCDVYVNWRSGAQSAPAETSKRDVNSAALEVLPAGQTVGLYQQVGEWRLTGDGATGLRLALGRKTRVREPGPVSGRPELTARAATWSKNHTLFAYLLNTRRLLKWRSSSETTRPGSIAQVGNWVILQTFTGGGPDQGVRHLKVRRLAIPGSR